MGLARTLDPTAHALRRDVFVDAGQHLIEVKGYDQLTVEELLDSVGASKGAFYHYFDSKVALLDAVVERMTEAAAAIIEPIVTDPTLSAVQKLEAVFAGIARWKGERTDLVLAVLQVWLADENAIVREKFRRRIAWRLTPLLADIVEQGQAEGRFTASSADHVARVLVSLIQGANEVATDLYFARRAGTVSFAFVESRLAAYSEAFDRTLGLPAGSLRWLDHSTLRQWFG